MEQELTDKQVKFIDAYLSSKSITETCKKLNISRSNAYQQYLNDPIIKAEISKRRSELLSDTTLYLQDKLQECSKVLIDIVKDKKTPPQVKVNAINSIFTNFNKLVETNDIMTKLAELENRLADQEDKANNESY